LTIKSPGGFGFQTPPGPPPSTWSETQKRDPQSVPARKQTHPKQDWVLGEMVSSPRKPMELTGKVASGGVVGGVRGESFLLWGLFAKAPDDKVGGDSAQGVGGGGVVGGVAGRGCRGGGGAQGPQGGRRKNDAAWGAKEKKGGGNSQARSKVPVPRWGMILGGVWTAGGVNGGFTKPFRTDELCGEILGV